MIESGFTLAWIDYAVMAVYFIFVLGIGWALKRYMKDASAFLEAAGPCRPGWPGWPSSPPTSAPSR